MPMIWNSVQDKSKSSVEYQRKTWNELNKNINRLVNDANAENYEKTVTELFGLNLIRGRGLFSQSCIRKQTASPNSTDVIAALVADVNSRYCQVGYLLVRRVTLMYQCALKRNNKKRLLSAAKFIAHLVNRRVVHAVLAFEVAEELLKTCTNDRAEVAVVLVAECGSVLQDHCSLRLDGIFELFLGIIHEWKIDEHPRFLIDWLFAELEAKFQDYPAVRPELDVFDMEGQVTHIVSLYHKIDPEIALNVFSPDRNFVQNEKKYEEMMVEIQSGDEADSDCEESSEEDDEQTVTDYEEARTALRSRMCLAIMTSVDCREAGRKLLDIKVKPGQEMELCTMLVEDFVQERGHLPYYGLAFYGLVGQQFCERSRIYQEKFEECFYRLYSIVHKLEINQMCNVAQLFAHLLYTDALPWHILSCIRLTEDDTTSLSRSFIKFLFLKLSEHMGTKLLNERLTDPGMQDSFQSIFPRDNPENAIFAINFFTSIGLDRSTENLQVYLKNMEQQKDVQEFDPQSASYGSDSDSSQNTVTRLADSGSDDEWVKITKSTRTENDSDDEWVKITKSTRTENDSDDEWVKITKSTRNDSDSDDEWM